MFGKNKLSPGMQMLFILIMVLGIAYLVMT
jgi:hypothetical protein